jgi:hypothetical protein
MTYGEDGGEYGKEDNGEAKKMELIREVGAVERGASEENVEEEEVVVSMGAAIPVSIGAKEVEVVVATGDTLWQVSPVVPGEVSSEIVTGEEGKVREMLMLAAAVVVVLLLRWTAGC